MNPIDSETHKLRGTFRKDRHEKTDPLPIPEGVPEPPGWLSEAGRELWPSLAPPLHEAGLLKAPDACLCGLLCEAMAEFIHLRELAAAEPAVVQAEGSKMQRVNPLIVAAREARAECLRLLCELGGTPRARRGLPVEPPKRGEIKPFGFV